LLEKHMNTKFHTTLLAAGFALTAMSASAVAPDVIDARQETQIWTTFVLNPYLRNNDLHAVVKHGAATLTGNVAEGVDKELAGQIALGVAGITSVDNQIVVQSTYMPPARGTSRSYGETVDDATITASVKSKLMWSTYTNGIGTNVDTKWGKVTLAGKADTAAAKDLAGRLAMNTRGVTSVDNQLVVEAPKPSMGDKAKVSAQEAKTDMDDGWITTKIKSTYMYSSNVDGSDIDVKTTGGVVTLSGKVDSGAERELAIELAKNVRGVKSVDAKGLSL
jgi:hyperosmotically inducible periplasmic protein